MRFVAHPRHFLILALAINLGLAACSSGSSKLPFLVIDLATDGSYTVIGYPSREYVWIMARAKSLPEQTWTEILARLKTQGYNISKIERVPTR
jgi:lipocalin